jgi:transposase InsO family protein
MASSILAACPPEEVVMFRFWKEESEDAQEAAAADSQLRGEIDAAESDGGSPRAVEADEFDLDESPPLLAGDDNESSPLFAGGDDESVSPEPTEGEDGETADTEEAERPTEVPEADLYPLIPPSGRKTRRKARPQETTRQSFTPQQRLLLLDTWQRSGLPAKDFSALVGISQNSLYKWKRQFERLGPEGLLDQPKGARRGSRLPEVTKRTILMLKRSHPDWGCQRISDALVRGPALSASPSAVARVLHEAGYETVLEPTRAHRDKVRRFERARPNQLWQTDLFTFMLKRQNRRLYLVAFLDDHSRFIVSFGLHASASTSLVIEALEAGIANYGPPEELLTDNGPQYVTWRGKSRFTKQLEKRGIKQLIAKPKRPQTLGKIERFWGTLWRELVETAVFQDLADARDRIGHFIDYYNFQRTHTGIGGLVPADRFFGATQEVLQTLKGRVAANALELARHGRAKQPFYVTGQVSGQSFSVHSQGERLVLVRDGEKRQEIELTDPPKEESAELPKPVCPHAAPQSWPNEPAEMPPNEPGKTVFDEVADTADPTEDSEETDAEGGRS